MTAVTPASLEYVSSPVHRKSDGHVKDARATPHAIQRDTPFKQESVSGQLHPHEVVDLVVAIILAPAVSQQMLNPQQTYRDLALERKMKRQPPGAEDG